MMGKNRKIIKLWLKICLFGIYFIFKYLKKNRKKNDIIKKNIHVFLRKELREVNEYKEHKEALGEYCIDSSSIFKDFFIPHKCNHFKPKILRTRSLLSIFLFLIMIKVALVSFLFFNNPFGAKMSTTLTSEIFNLINNSRTSVDINPLKRNPVLDKVAMEKARDMIEKNYFSHTSPDARLPWDFINRNEYPYIYVGENLAINFTSSNSAHNALLKSPTHKKNIMNENYTDVGISVITGEFDSEKTNILVQIFASKKEAGREVRIASLEKSNDVIVRTLPVTEILSSDFVGKEDFKKIEKPTTVVSDVPATSLTKQENIIEELITQDPKEANKVEVVLDTIEAGMPIGSINEIDLTNDLSIVQIKSENTTSNKLITGSRLIFWFVSISLLILLIITISIESSIVHKPMILQTLFVVVFIVGLVYIKVNGLETTLETIKLL